MASICLPQRDVSDPSSAATRAGAGVIGRDSAAFGGKPAKSRNENLIQCPKCVHANEASPATKRVQARCSVVIIGHIQSRTTGKALSLTSPKKLARPIQSAPYLMTSQSPEPLVKIQATGLLMRRMPRP